MYFVYMILCADKTLYTGITTDLMRRFREHKDGKGGHYTASHPVVKIVYSERFSTRSAALQREAAIKALSKKQKSALARLHA